MYSMKVVMKLIIFKIKTCIKQILNQNNSFKQKQNHLQFTSKYKIVRKKISNEHLL